jgi:hypothetical protein
MFELRLGRRQFSALALTLIPAAAIATRGFAQSVPDTSGAQRLSEQFLGFVDKGNFYSNSDIAALSNLLSQSVDPQWPLPAPANQFVNQMLSVSSSLGGLNGRTLIKPFSFRKIPLTNQTGDFVVFLYEASHNTTLTREEVYLVHNGNAFGNNEFDGWRLLGAHIRQTGVDTEIEQAGADLASSFLNLLTPGQDNASAFGQFYDKSVGGLWSKNTDKSGFRDTLTRIATSLQGPPTRRRLIETRKNTSNVGNGEIFIQRYLTIYPIGLIEEEVDLNKVSSQQWKVVGAHFSAAITA